MKRENRLKNFNDIPESMPHTIDRILTQNGGQRKFDERVEKVKKSCQRWFNY